MPHIKNTITCALMFKFLIDHLNQLLVLPQIQKVLNERKKKEKIVNQTQYISKD